MIPTPMNQSALDNPQELDAGYTPVVDRCIEPLVTPPPALERTGTDIAFAASVTISDGAIWLYYSLADKKFFRAIDRRG